MIRRMLLMGFCVAVTLQVSCSSGDHGNAVSHQTGSYRTGASPSSIDVDANPVVLGFGETVLLEPLELEITFYARQNDSRCPIGVNCFWEGMAEIDLRVVEKVSDTHLVILPIYGHGPGMLPGFHHPVDTLGYRFSLLTLEPYPVYDSTYSDSDFVATFTVFPYSSPNSGKYDDVIITSLLPNLLQFDQFGLTSAAVNGDKITLDLWHSGGCGEHSFNLYMVGGFMESYPVQANLYLQHFDHADPCDAIVHREVPFNLEPIAASYREAYGSLDPIILNILGYDYLDPQQTISVTYYPSDGRPPDGPLEALQLKDIR